MGKLEQLIKANDKIALLQFLQSETIESLNRDCIQMIENYVTGVLEGDSKHVGLVPPFISETDKFKQYIQVLLTSVDILHFIHSIEIKAGTKQWYYLINRVYKEKTTFWGNFKVPNINIANGVADYLEGLTGFNFKAGDTIKSKELGGETISIYTI